MPKKFKLGLYRRFFNQNLKGIIEKKGLKYYEISKMTGIYSALLSRIINFKSKPTEEQKIQLAIALNIPVDDIFPEKYDEIYKRVAPLPNKTYGQIDMKFLDFSKTKELTISPDYISDVDNAVTKDLIKKHIDKLSIREQKIINMRFGIEDGISHTFEETAQRIGVTRERIRQIETKALEKLKMIIKEKEPCLCPNYL